VRVLRRLLRRAKGVLGDGAALGQAAFRTRTRSVRRVTQQLHRVARRQGEQAADDRKQAYAKLSGIAQARRRQATRVAAELRDRAADQGQRLAERFEHALPLVDRAIAQATRRVLQGEAVPAADKLLSLCAPHTQAIRRHKPGKPTAFGRKVLLSR
jgi:IS5 family transposase